MTTVAEALAQAVEHHRAGRPAEAEALCRRILAALPDHPAALHLLGVLAYEAGHYALAAEHGAKATAGYPAAAEYHQGYGLALSALGQHDKAAAALRRALAIDPRRYHANWALGRCLLAAGDPAGAADALRAESALDPANAAAFFDLGVASYYLERLDEAESCFRRAAEIAPAHAPAWNNWAAIRIERGDPEGAAPLYEAAYQRDAGYAEAYSNRLQCEQFRAGVTPEGLKALSLGWNDRFSPRSIAAVPARKPDGTLRIGFVSPDFKRAPVGYFLAGLLEALDRRRVATVLYSDTAAPDDLSTRLQRAAGAWREIRGQGNRELAAAVRDDRIDILFDLAGHTKGNRLPAFAQRLAPVQITWAGYAGTTGLSAMDYLLADRFEVPEGAEEFYSETVLRLPNDYVCYSPPHYAPPVGPLPVLAAQRITFGGFHNAGKIGVLSLALWCRVLAAVPGSHLVLKYLKLDDRETAARIRGVVAAAGVAPERVVIEGTSPHIAMLRRYNDIDIALDSLPYSGGLTTCEALWMGVPVITLPGRSFAGRHSLTHLVNAGLPEMVARDEEDYVAIARGLAADLDRLAGLRRELRPRMAASPLCDAARFARDFTMLMEAVAVRP